MTGPQVTDPTLQQDPNNNLEGQQPPIDPNQQVIDPSNPLTNQPRTYTEAEMRTIHDLYGQTLRENETRLQELQNKLQQAPQVNNQQQNQQPDDFLTNGRDIVGQEIEKRLQPFTAFIAQTQQQSLYVQLKDTFKKHPTFSNFFTIPQAETLLDQQVSQMLPGNLNTQSLAGLISQIYGYMAMNNMIPQAPLIQQPLNNPQFNQPQQPILQQNNNQPMTNVPPHLRPSAPPMPSNMNPQNLTPKGNVRRQLTELERRVARENHLNDDDYIDWISISSTDVYKSDVGKPAGGQ